MKLLIYYDNLMNTQSCWPVFYYLLSWHQTVIVWCTQQTAVDRAYKYKLNGYQETKWQWI